MSQLTHAKILEMARVNSNYQRLFALDLTVAANLGMPTHQKCTLQCPVTAVIHLANPTAAVERQ